MILGRMCPPRRTLSSLSRLTHIDIYSLYRAEKGRILSQELLWFVVRDVKNGQFFYSWNYKNGGGFYSLKCKRGWSGGYG